MIRQKSDVEAVRRIRSTNEHSDPNLLPNRTAKDRRRSRARIRETNVRSRIGKTDQSSNRGGVDPRNPDRSNKDDRENQDRQ